MINTSVPNFSVTIGGVDVSAAVVSVESRDADNGRGLITQQGTMVLGAYEGSSLDFNDRTNPDFWAIGQPIAIQIANSSNVLTIFKSLRIVGVNYDPTTHLQTLEIGCVLKLIDYPVIRDCAVKSLDTRLGFSKSKTAFINGFLDYFGLPAMVGTVPGSINYPIIGDSASLAGLAGQLAYDSGLALWVDQEENVIPISRRLTEAY